MKDDLLKILKEQLLTLEKAKDILILNILIR